MAVAKKMVLICILALVVSFAAQNAFTAETKELSWMKDSIEKMEKELVEKYGAGQKERVQQGLEQVSRFWREDDGDAKVFEAFVRKNFAGDKETLDATFERYERNLEALDGNMNAIRTVFGLQTDLDIGPILGFDEIFAAYAPWAHVSDDFFQNKLAFIVLLNFPLTTLEQKLTDGENWTRRQWAETRLAQRYSKRIPAEVSLAIARAGAASDQYIADYNIWMYHLVDDDGKRLFPKGLKLLSHWNLRDELKANYDNPQNGLEKQRMIVKVMERIVEQTIPEVVVNSPHVDWNPYTNEVFPAAESDSDELLPEGMKITNSPEPDTRYKILLDTYLAARLADPYSPTAPSLIARRFDENREIPEERVEKMLTDICSSPLLPEVAKLIEKRLGRPLEPFDIWYNGFKPKSVYTEEQLNKMVSEKYPTAEAFEKDIPKFLVTLGFTEERAAYIADKIVVEPARGSGHASGTDMRGQQSRLRTRVGKNGMDYKGFNIAVHELGHNVEQTISLYDVDYISLEGVPNTAFTEGFAFVFQQRDLELLGLERPEDPQSEALAALNDFWMTYEIGGVSLLDMKIWHWMYDHPEATPAELKEAVIQLSKDVWNKYFAPVIKQKDVALLGVYSHIIHSFLYLPDYPMGHMIAFQMERQVEKAGSVGPEFERMAVAGNIAPDLWMINATGSPVGAEAMLEAAKEALAELQ